MKVSKAMDLVYNELQNFLDNLSEQLEKEGHLDEQLDFSILGDHPYKIMSAIIDECSFKDEEMD